MRSIRWMAAVAILALAPLSGAQAAASADKTGERKALADAVNVYNGARAHCRTLHGQERRVCFAEARATYRKAEAHAVAEYRDTPRARMDAEINAANAELALARTRCAGKPAREREACRTAAKDAQRQAVAEAVRKEHAAAPGTAAATKLALPPPTPASPPVPAAAPGTAKP